MSDKYLNRAEVLNFVYTLQADRMADAYARLKAEAERLRQQVDYWRIESDCNHGRWLRCLEDLEHLRASSFVTAVPSEQYERVIKAGDKMAHIHVFLGFPSYTEDWNAAKKGGQP